MTALEALTEQAEAAGISVIVLEEAGLCVLYPPNTDGRPVYVDCGAPSVTGEFPSDGLTWLAARGYLSLRISGEEEASALLDVIARYGAPSPTDGLTATANLARMVRRQMIAESYEAASKGYCPIG